MNHFIQYKSLGEVGLGGEFSQSNWKKMDHFLQYTSMGVKGEWSEYYDPIADDLAGEDKRNRDLRVEGSNPANLYSFIYFYCCPLEMAVGNR